MIEMRQAGAFANDGERRVVREFRSRLPPGTILLTNLFLPDHQDMLEIDLVAITPLGVFVVEVKDWRGDVQFKRGDCTHRGIRRDDPRKSISMKAKKVHGLLLNERPIANLQVVTNPLLVLANDEVKLSGNLHESVPVLRFTAAAQTVAAGRLVGHRQSSPLTPTEIRTVADLLHSCHSADHQPQLGNYRLGDKLDSPYEEYAAVEVNDPAHRVRLKRHPIDPLVSARERDEQRLLASRHVVALRQLQPLHSTVIPVVYTCFDDPDDDSSIWTAYESVDGLPLAEASATPKAKLAALVTVAETLQACHEAGVLHRALTSDCIILPRGRRTPVLLHFDFARVRGKQTIAVEPVRKKLRELRYVAPEVRQDPSQASSASDVFSLGVCSVEALANRRLETRKALLGAVQKLRPRELAAFLPRMMEEVPGRRPVLPHATDTFRKASR